MKPDYSNCKYMQNNKHSTIDIRVTQLPDKAALETLYSAAFPDENLIPLVEELLSEEDAIISYCAIRDGSLVGHIIFTMCRINGRSEKISLLGPVAVSPQFQRQGIGTALIEAGIERLKKSGTTQVNVLGDPAYYSRFGFEPDTNIAPPYDLPQQWQTGWQVISLQGEKLEFKGTLSVPKPWRRQALWAP